MAHESPHVSGLLGAPVVQVSELWNSLCISWPFPANIGPFFSSTCSFLGDSMVCGFCKENKLLAKMGKLPREATQVFEHATVIRPRAVGSRKTLGCFLLSDVWRLKRTHFPYPTLRAGAPISFGFWRSERRYACPLSQDGAQFSSDFRIWAASSLLKSSTGMCQNGGCALPSWLLSCQFPKQTNPQGGIEPQQIPGRNALEAWEPWQAIDFVAQHFLSS